MGFDLNIYSITSGLSWFPAKGVILLPTLAFTSSHFSPCARKILTSFLSYSWLFRCHEVGWVSLPFSVLGLTSMQAYLKQTA